MSFGLAFIFTILTYKNYKAFFLFLTAFIGFFVYAGNLELWILISCVIVDIIIIYLSYNNKSRSI